MVTDYDDDGIGDGIYQGISERSIACYLIDRDQRVV